MLCLYPLFCEKHKNWKNIFLVIKNYIIQLGKEADDAINEISEVLTSVFVISLSSHSLKKIKISVHQYICQKYTHSLIIWVTSLME